MPIPAEASKIHGISNQDVADKPKFDEIAPILSEFLNDCDLSGFNAIKFDIPILCEEFIRAGVPFDMKNRKFVDVQVIFHKMEERTLKAAYKFYCDKDLVDAHTALADTNATFEILNAQLKKYNQLMKNVDFLSEFSNQRNSPDLEGKFVYDLENNVVFNFGKYKGRKAKEVFNEDPYYYQWMMEKDFLLSTKNLITQIWKQVRS
jgi:DNA polymerase-3 subunit epsilon